MKRVAPNKHVISSFFKHCRASCLYWKIKSLLLRNVIVAKSYQPSRGLLFSSKKGVSRDFIAWMQQPLDLSRAGILRWMKQKWWITLVGDHSFQLERHQVLGSDLAAAHFVVARDGSVKFEGFNRWIKKNPVDGKYILPSVRNVDLRLEAVDLSETQAMYVSFDNFVNLQYLKYLSVAGCPNIDDWCLDRLVKFRDTLLVLDLSRCPRVTERGLASLHKLHRLRRLVLYDMPAVRNIQLTALLLEEVLPAGCVIEGVDFTKPAQVESSSDSAVPVFLKEYEQLAWAEENAKYDDVVVRDGLNGVQYPAVRTANTNKLASVNKGK